MDEGTQWTPPPSTPRSLSNLPAFPFPATEKTVEVPVEKVVNVPVEVPVEKVVEKIVKVPVEVVKELPVEVVKTKEILVPVDKVVEKVVDDRAQKQTIEVLRVDDEPQGNLHRHQGRGQLGRTQTIPCGNI